MSGTTLRLLPDELRATAAALGRLSNETGQMQSELDRAWARLDTGWDSYVEEDIHGYFNEIMSEISEMVAMLAQMGQVLVFTADEIEAADQSAVTLFGESSMWSGSGIAEMGRVIPDSAVVEPPQQETKPDPLVDPSQQTR